MSDKPIPTPGNVLGSEQAEAVGGGTCTPADILPILSNLTQAYESLVDFTSHVIERVVN
jgi:hypothetical protein